MAEEIPKTTYSFWIGAKKTIKNFLITWGPAILALLANVPVEYGAVAGILAYFIKNYVENK